MKKGRIPDYLLDSYILKNFVNNFPKLLLLLCKTNVFEIFNEFNFFQILVISRSTEILIKSNS